MEPVKAPEQTIHLADYWHVITKRKSLLITFICVTIIATTAVSFRMKPVYQAEARMVVERESSSSPVTGQSTGYIDVQSQLLTFNTHFKLITSKPVIESLLADLDNADGKEDAAETQPSNPVQVVAAYMHSNIDRLKDNIKLLLKQERIEPSKQEIIDRRIQLIQKQVKISPERETRLLNIDVQDTNPAMAAKIANLLAQKYIEFDLATRLASENKNMEWLSKEVYSLKKRLEDDEKAFSEFKQLNKVISLEGQQKVIDQKISELNNEYLATRSKRQELDAKLVEINKQHDGYTDIAYVRSILNNDAIDAIYANLTDLELEQSRLGKVFRSKHPKIQQVSSEIVKVKAKLNGELTKEIENLKVQQTVLLNREKTMEQTMAGVEDDAMNTNSKEFKYTILQRNKDTSQQLYDTLVAKIKESGIASSSGTSNIRIVEQASVPIDPVKPNKKKNLLLAIILSVFGGVSLAFFLEYLDQSVRTEEDVQILLGLPVLSVIPIAGKADREG